MSESLLQRAGSAAGWQAVQYGATQAIYFLRLIILARLLAPDAFGLLAIATVAIGVLVRVSDLGIVPALVQRREATERQFDAAWTLGLLRAVAIAGCLALAAPVVATAFGEPRAAPIVAVLALRGAIDAFASIEIARLTRDLRFRELAKIRVPPAVIDTVAAVALASRLGVWALVAGALAGALATTLLSYVVAPRRLRFRLGLAELTPLLRFGRWVLVIGIISLAGSSVSQVAISNLLGAAGLGLYFLAARLAFLPSEAVGAVVRPIAFPVFARSGKGQQAAVAFRRLLVTQSALVIPGCALAIALAPALEQVLGGRWAGTAPVVRILALASVVGLYGDTVSPALMGLGRPQRVALMEAVQSGVWLLALLPLIAAAGIAGAALAWLVANVTTQFVGWWALRPLLPGALSGVKTRLLAVTAAAAGSGLLAAITARGLTGLPGLAAGAIVGLTCVGLLLLALDRSQDLGLHKLWALSAARMASDLRGRG